MNVLSFALFLTTVLRKKSFSSGFLEISKSHLPYFSKANYYFQRFRMDSITTSKNAISYEHLLIAPNSDGVKFAAKIIADGDIVAFPTETVYGLGCFTLVNRCKTFTVLLSFNKCRSKCLE